MISWEIEVNLLEVILRRSLNYSEVEGKIFESSFFCSRILNSFPITGLFLYPLKISEKLWLLVFSSGIEKN